MDKNDKKVEDIIKYLESQGENIKELEKQMKATEEGFRLLESRIHTARNQIYSELPEINIQQYKMR